jgi:uncharacterized protein (TIGR00369 family)
MTETLSADELATVNAFGAAFLPGHLGIVFTAASAGRMVARLPVRQAMMAPNGFLHAGAVVTLADSACGYGCLRALPEGASGFTTIELKSNFLGTARDGEIEAEARLVHGGRTTQVWDAEVRAVGKDPLIALFRCTQMILWPKASAAAR